MTRSELPVGAGQRLAVVVAHPDDETFGCGSLLLEAAARDVTTSVVCATRGEAGEVADGVAVPPGGLAELREAELRAAAALLGVDRVEVLDYADSGMAGPPADGSLAGADLAQVAAVLGDVLDRLRPDAVITLDASDGHRDHARVRDATLLAAATRELPVHLHCLARSAMRAWAAHMQRVDPGNTYLHLGELGTPEDEVTVVLDTRAHRERRWEAIRAHRSQRSPFDDLPPEVADLFLCADHLRSLPLGARSV